MEKNTELKNVYFVLVHHHGISRRDECWRWMSVVPSEHGITTLKGIKSRAQNWANYSSSKMYHEYLKPTIKVFGDIKKFLKAANEIGMNPNIDKDILSLAA